MGWNQATRGGHLAFDPYPFIFLNLMLSMLAAIQAPVIMMSQNRAAARDREAAEHDYTVNLRAELEIMHLHDKMDALREKQMIELLKRQNEAIELAPGAGRQTREIAFRRVRPCEAPAVVGRRRAGRRGACVRGRRSRRPPPPGRWARARPRRVPAPPPGAGARRPWRG